MDTLTQANQERKSQGPWEAELSYGGEADLHQHLNKCQKNPGHLKFIPVDSFSMDHLPPFFHDSDIIDYIRAMSDLTVRISVKYVSDARPLTCPGSARPYPCYTHRGRNLMRVGTGLITSVCKFEDLKLSVCSCNECLKSPTPKTKFAYITIYTAAHVVFDDKEGEHTMCHLFFDKGSTPDVCNDVVTLSRMSHVRGDVERDLSDMIFVTHDLDLIDRLNKMVDRLWSLKVKVLGKYPPLHVYEKHNKPIPAELEAQPPLLVLVSHPHGCSKQVSVGHCSHRTNLDGTFNQVTYTTSTCPGSSGASVFVIGKGEWGLAFEHVHSGNSEEDRELNFSGLGWDLIPDQKRTGGEQSSEVTAPIGESNVTDCQ